MLTAKDTNDFTLDRPFSGETVTLSGAAEAIVIRTTPNDTRKLSKNDSNTNPPFGGLFFAEIFQADFGRVGFAVDPGIAVPGKLGCCR